MRYFDPDDERHMKGLYNSISWSDRQLDPHREFRNRLIRDYGTPEFNEDFKKADMEEKGGYYKVLFNTWRMAVDLTLLRVAGGLPQIALATAFEELLPFSAEYEAVVNAELKKLRFGETFREWVKDSLFGLGVLRVCYRDPDIERMLPGVSNESQSITVETIDLNDFVLDMRAKRFSECDYMGHRYRLEFREVLDSPIFSDAAKDRLLPSNQVQHISGADDQTVDRMALIERAWSTEDDLNEYVYLRDIYIAKAGIIVTIASGQDTVPPLRVRDYRGPETGEYHILKTDRVPTQIMPATQGHQIKPMNDFFNSLLRKLEDQARNQKTVVAVNSGHEDDGTKVSETVNGSVISVSDPSAIREINFNGPNAQNLSLVPVVYDYLSRISGNLDSLGGLGPQSNTVGQDQLIASTVNERMASLGDSVLTAMADVAKHIGWLVWHDQENSYFVQREIEGTGIHIPVQIVPYDREGAFLDYNFSILPHSISHTPPTARAQAIRGIIGELVMPAMPFMAQQGVHVRWQRLLESLSKYLSLPELNNIFEYGAPQEIGSGAGQIRKSPTSSRTYHRISSSARQGSAKSVIAQSSRGNSDPPVVSGKGG